MCKNPTHMCHVIWHWCGFRWFELNLFWQILFSVTGSKALHYTCSFAIITGCHSVRPFAGKNLPSSGGNVLVCCCAICDDILCGRWSLACLSFINIFPRQFCALIEVVVFVRWINGAFRAHALYQYTCVCVCVKCSYQYIYIPN